MIVQPSSSQRFIAPDVPARFRQNADFLYLTGLHDVVGVFVMHGDERRLFGDEKSDDDVQWHGRGESLASRARRNDIAHLSPLAEFAAFLRDDLSAKNKRLRIFAPDSSTFSGHPCADTFGSFISADNRRVRRESSTPFLHELRSCKSDAEADVMRFTCRQSGEALVDTIRFSQAGMRESMLGSKFELEARRRGLDALAFPPVCASAERAAAVHYIANADYIESDRPVLMDAGAELFGYCSDISRTWPIAPRFSAAHRQLYELLFGVQAQLVDALRVGPPYPSLLDMYQSMLRLLGDELRKAGIAPQPNSAGRNYGAHIACCHNVGHHLGLDVHDAADAPRQSGLQARNVVTVEPGVYFAVDATFVPVELRGVGMRIEDDVLLGESGIEVLTEHCPKQIDDVERLRSA